MNYKFTELTRRRTKANSDYQNNIKVDVISDNETFENKLFWRKSNISERSQVLLKVLILCISGNIAAFSMPGFNISALAWFGFIPLISTIILEKSLNKSLLYSFAFGFGFYAVTLIWLLSLHPLKWLGLGNIQSIILSTTVWLGISAYLSCYIVFFCLITRTFLCLNAGNIFKSILTALCWVIITNKLSSIGQFAFPWALVEYSQYKNLNLLQITQYIGGIGLGFLIIFFNCVLTFIFIDFIKKKQTAKNLALNITYSLAFILVFHLIGWIILNNDGSFKSQFAATIIQNHSTLENKSNERTNLKAIKNNYLTQIFDSPSGIIVLPEAAVYDFIRYKDRDFYKNLDKISRLHDKTIVIGALDLVYNEDRKPVPTNAAIVLDKILPMQPENVYNKQILVPFGEYIPFRKYIPDFLNKFINNISGTDFYPGKYTKVIKTSMGNIAPTICYEIVFPELIRKQVNDEAEILVNLSSLCWYHDSIIKDQFVAFGVMRAAEFKRPCIIAVNTGNSVFIDFNGKIIKKLPKNKAITVTARLNHNNEKTFYSKLFL